MLMILARLVRSESFWAVVKVRSPHTGPEVCYIIERSERATGVSRRRSESVGKFATCELLLRRTRTRHPRPTTPQGVSLSRLGGHFSWFVVVSFLFF